VARNKDFVWSAIDELVWPSCRRPIMLGERFMRNIWLLIPGLEEHKLDSCNIKFEIGALIAMADADTDERLRLDVEVPGDVVGTCGIGREGRLESSLEGKYLVCKRRLLKVCLVSDQWKLEKEEIDQMLRLLFQRTWELRRFVLYFHLHLIHQLMLNIDICWHDVLDDDCLYDVHNLH